MVINQVVISIIESIQILDQTRPAITICRKITKLQTKNKQKSRANK